MFTIVLVAVCVLASHGATIKRTENHVLPSWKRGWETASYADSNTSIRRQTAAEVGELSTDLTKMMANFTATMKEIEGMSDVIKDMPALTVGQNPEVIFQIMEEMEKYMAEFETSMAKLEDMKQKRDAGQSDLPDFSPVPDFRDIFDVSEMTNEMEGMKANLTAAMKELENMSSMMIGMQMGNPNNSPFDISQIMGEIDNVMANFTASMKDLDAMTMAMKNGGGHPTHFLQQYGGDSLTEKDLYDQAKIQKRYDAMTGYNGEMPDFSSQFDHRTPDFSSQDMSRIFENLGNRFHGMDSGTDLDQMLSGLDGLMTDFSQSMENLKALGIQINETVPLETIYHIPADTVESQGTFDQELEEIKDRVEILEEEVSDLKDNSKTPQFGSETMVEAVNPRYFQIPASELH